MYNLLQNQKVRANFAVSELACKCGCNSVKWEERFADMLQTLRERSGGPLIVRSGYRCPTHNSRIGGATRSRHMAGDAADVYSNIRSNFELLKIAESMGFGGIGIGSTIVHVDTRPGRSRWYYRNNVFTKEVMEHLERNGYVPY